MELNSIKMENEELYPEDFEHDCEFLNGMCTACSEKCPQCKGTKTVEEYYDEYENGQIVGVGTVGPKLAACECSLE